MSSKDDPQSVKKGATFAVTAYVLWGLFPLYWKLLKGVDSLELIAHRVVWSLAFVAAVCLLQGAWPTVRAAFANGRLVGLHLASGALLSINWLSYVWAVTHDRVIEASLGYYLVPLVNVLAGRFLLNEKLTRLQIGAVLLAGLGVSLQFTSIKDIPWLALVIAASWGGYGLLRKRSPLGSLEGLTVETALYAPLGAGLLAWLAWHGAGALGHETPLRTTLVLCSGAVTAVPLLLFASGARRLRFTTLGLLQYIVPTMTFSLALFVYREPASTAKLVSFGLIWCALALYSLAERLK